MLKNDEGHGVDFVKRKRKTGTVPLLARDIDM